MVNFCNKCGNKLELGSLFCDKCGNRIYSGNNNLNSFSNQASNNINPFVNINTQQNNPFSNFSQSTKANLPNWNQPQQSFQSSYPQTSRQYNTNTSNPVLDKYNDKKHNQKCAIYLDALDLMQGDSESINKAISLFELISDFRDSKAKIKECKDNIANLKLISMLE